MVHLFPMTIKYLTISMFESMCPDLAPASIIRSVVAVGPDGALKVELHKSSVGLGFSLEGGRASAHGDRPLHVKRIFKGKKLSS